MKETRNIILTAVLTTLFAGNLWAAQAVVYENVFSITGPSAQSIDLAGIINSNAPAYRFELTDLQFPDSLNFLAMAVGTTDQNIATLIGSGSFTIDGTDDNLFLSLFAQPSSIQFGSYSVKISEIPLPGAALLFGTSMLGLAGASKLRKNNKQS